MAHRPDQQVGKPCPLVHAVAPEGLIVHVALHMDVQPIFPGETDTAVELDGPVRDGGRRIGRGEGDGGGGSGGSQPFAQVDVTVSRALREGVKLRGRAAREEVRVQRNAV